MKVIYRVFLMAAPLALAGLASAPSAPAFTGSFTDVAGAVCSDVPTDAAAEIASAYANWDTSSLDAKGCQKVCNGIRKACDDQAKNLGKCHNSQIKRQDTIEREECKALADKQERADCMSAVKAEKAACTDILKDEGKTAKSDCLDLEATCSDDCSTGTLFPTP